MSEGQERKFYLDNIRWGIVLLVLFYHVLYIFNSVGVIANVTLQGYPQADILLNFIYPWFMNCLFVVAGISARFSLKKRSSKQFMKERVMKLLVPSIAGTLLLGWMSGYVTDQGVHMFAASATPVPGIAKYFIYSLMGIGPIWFLHQLFVASILLLLIRAIDKKEKLYELGGKVNMIILILLAVLVWGSSYLLNTPLITVYRNGIYCLMFLFGYYIFSHDNILAMLKKYHLPLGIVALITGITYSIFFYGENYTTDACLHHPFTNFYAWIMILALLGCSQVWFAKSNRVTCFLSERSFGYYIIHYPCLIMIAYLVSKYMKLSIVGNFVLILILELAVTFILNEIFRKIPFIKTVLLGMKKKK